VSAGIRAGLDVLDRNLVGACQDCEAHPAGLCDDHGEDLDRTDAYLALARALGIDVER
jgi:hypothetical protein